jgi:hypothetical protein
MYQPKYYNKAKGPHDARFLMYTSSDLKDRAMKAAREQRLSLTEWVRVAMKQRLEEQRT